jgi:hypothetical protein
MKRSPFLLRRIAAFAAAAFGEQHAGVVHAGRVELPELHVLQRDAGARRHAQAVAGVDEGVGAGGEDAPGAAGGQQRGLGLEDVHLAGFHLQRHHADHVAVGVADQVQRHPLDEEVGARLARSAGTACAASRGRCGRPRRRRAAPGFSP